MLAGAALTLAFPEPDLAFGAWIAPAGLLVVSRGGGWRRGAALGFLFGVGFFGTLLYWISIIGWAGWLLLTLLQAAFLALFGGLWAIASRTTNTGIRVIAAPVTWVAVEYLRSFVPVVGFTWGQLAQSQHNLEWMLRPARIGGGWLVAFAVMLIASLVAEAIFAITGKSETRARIARAAPPVLLALVVLGYPFLIGRAAATGRPLRAAIVQGNVPRDFAGTTLEKELEIIESHERLTTALRGSEVDLVVWPESSVGIDLERNRAIGDAVASAARAAGAEMVVGANLDIDRDHYKVVALHVSAAGEIVDRYQKTHLVPFGEYVPGRGVIGGLPVFDQVPRDAIPASEATIFDAAGGRIAPVISFEGDFGSLVRGRIGEGGRLLIVATNTSTWNDSWASAQHVAFSQVRAAENGVWTIHAALSGISAFISPAGTVVDSTSLWTESTLLREVAFSTGASFYARTGDWVAWLSLVGTVALVAASLRRGRVRRTAEGGSVPEAPAPTGNPSAPCGNP